MADFSPYTSLVLPHYYDRYSLFSIFLKYYRSLLNLTQTDLVDRINENLDKKVLNQSYYSRIEKIGYFKNKARPLDKKDRGKILSILEALNVPFNENCLLLWLVEGEEFQLLDQAERQHFFPKRVKFDYENRIKNDFWFAHNQVIEALKNCLLKKLPSLSKRRIEVAMSHGLSDSNFVKNQKRLFNLEKGGGHRLYLGKYPSVLLTSDPEKLAKTYIGNNLHSQLQYKRFLERRIEKFNENLKIYGTRCIHSLSSLQRYVRPETLEHVDQEERTSRVGRMIELLKTEPNFHIALADSEPEWEIMIKSFECVALRPTSRSVQIKDNLLVHGPTLIYWQNEPLDVDRSERDDEAPTTEPIQTPKDQESIHLWNVVASYVDFELTWISLHDDGKTDRDYVISELSKLLR